MVSSKGQIKPKAGLARCRFSQKICFVCCESIKAKNKFVPSFFGRIYDAPICFRFYLTLNVHNNINHPQGKSNKIENKKWPRTSHSMTKKKRFLCGAKFVLPWYCTIYLREALFNPICTFLGLRSWSPRSKILSSSFNLNWKRIQHSVKLMRD